MSQENIKPLLQLTRHSADLTDSPQPWRALVEDTADHILLKVVRECSEEELSLLGYYGVALGRHQFLKWWWNRKALPQFQKPQTWINAIIGLQLYRLHIVKTDPLQLLLTIFKSAALRLLYPQMLAWETDHKVPQGFDYSALDDIEPLLRLRLLLVELASAIPNGTILLFAEWKKYQYPTDIVWNMQIPYRHSQETFEPEKDLSIKYNSSHTTDSYTPLLQMCRYGNIKDFRVALRNPEWWSIETNPIQPDSTIVYPLVAIVLNKNSKVFRCFMETIWSAKRACQSFSDEIAEQLWGNCYFSQFVKSKPVYQALRTLASKTVRDWRYRVKMLHWLCEECTEKKLTNCFDKQTIQNLNPRYNYCTYYHFVNTRPVHPKPEEVLWLETQQPLISPKADGVYYKGCLPLCHPVLYQRPTVQAECIDLDCCKLYMVFDVYQRGRWDQRVESFAVEHPYWHGPYATLGEENADLQKFLDLAKVQSWETIWWPKGVYSDFRGRRFFDLLAQPPATPYPNDGWVVAGCKGPFWKIKPLPQLTLDVLYVNGIWKLLHNRGYNKVITVFLEAPLLPVNIPHSTITAYIKQALHDMDSGTAKAKLQYFDNMLSLLALNLDYFQKRDPFRVVVQRKIKEFSHKDITRELCNRFQWMLTDPLVLPDGWRHEYNGGPLYDGVWRCEWDIGLGKWRPVSRRYDKLEPNDDKVARLLTNQHQYPWNPAQLWQFCNQRPYYNARGPKTKEIRALHKKQRKDISAFCSENSLFASCSVNLAGGYQSGYQESYDLDPYIVAEQNWMGKGEWIWADASNLMVPVSGEQYHLVPSGSVAVHKAIHYFAKDRESWLGFLNTISTQRILLVTMIDADFLFKVRNTYTMSDGSTMKRGKQGWHRGVWEGESCLKWRGGTVHNEPYIASSFVKQELIAAGWSLNSCAETELGVRIMLWTR